MILWLSAFKSSNLFPCTFIPFGDKPALKLSAAARALKIAFRKKVEVKIMAKKLETVKLVASLEKATRKTGKAVWNDLAERLLAPTRNRAVINVDRLDSLAKQFAGKTLVVPGKVLSQGEFNSKATIVAVSASALAKQKINAKGEFVRLIDFAKKADKIDVKKIVIVK